MKNKQELTPPDLPKGEEISPFGGLWGVECNMKESTKNNSKRPNWLTANRSFYPHVKPIRDDLKNEMTHAEKLLWKHLRSRQLDGYKFRRQSPIDRYIVDFVCKSNMLIVEIDGGQHAE